MITKIVLCPNCGKDGIVKKGLQSGQQRCQCKSCKKNFQLDYTYQARKPEVKVKIEEMAHNGSGVRDTARVLKINKNTVCNYFKKKIKN